MQDEQSRINKTAWSYRAYEHWLQYSGTPQECAAKIKANPEQRLRNHLAYLGDVSGKRVVNILGSNGRKAVPLAVLGAEVTVIDISQENARYARDLAREASVELNYIVADMMALDLTPLAGSFDIAYAEGGILHYFSDLDAFAGRVYSLLKSQGKLVLNDMHPVRKIIKKDDDGNLVLDGDYFETKLHFGSVAYEGFFPETERDAFPKCQLRCWRMGEIINAFASAGFIITRLDEGPRWDGYEHIPGTFTLVAKT